MKYPVNRSRIERFHSDFRHNCRTAMLFHAWIDLLSARERRPGSPLPFHALKKASLVMCDGKITAMVSSVQTSCSPADEPTVAAERELTAFYGAISATYGPEKAMQAAYDWIEELERPDGEESKSAPRHVAGPAPNWRYVTISAARRFASRVVHLPTGW